MIRYNLTRDKNQKIMTFAHQEADLGMCAYIKQYFHGEFTWNTASDKDGYWGTIDFSSEEHLTLFFNPMGIRLWNK